MSKLNQWLEASAQCHYLEVIKIVVDVCALIAALYAGWTFHSQLKAMQDANAFQVESERPWVGLSDAKVNSWPANPFSRTTASISNTGKTPARETLAIIGVSVFHSEPQKQSHKCPMVVIGCILEML